MRCLALRASLGCLLGCTLSVKASTLVLVSIDGFRWDYLDRPEAAELRAIAASGSRVEQLETVYPSKTFPAHLSIATGLPPTGHGIVDNYFCRSDRSDCYDMGDGRKDPLWLSGTPLWTLVEEQGGRASTFFWPESDAPFNGTLPTDYRRYDGRIPHSERVQQTLEWLALPELERPELITLYFSAVDSAGHQYGPDSDATTEAIADVDHWLGVLWRAIVEQNSKDPEADINLMIVSDHGMASVEPDAFIDTQSLPKPAGFKRVNNSTRVLYYQRHPDADIDRLRVALQGAAAGRFWVVEASELEARGFSGHPAVPDLVIETEPPRVFRHGGGKDADLRGMHGYPSDHEAMAALCVAAGPAFRVGQVIARAYQLDVYPVAARVLGLTPPAGLPSDGGALLDALRPPEGE